MPYTIDLQKAARRHLEAANSLAPPHSHRRDVAGYLYGLAAEMAVKAMMRNSGMRETAGGRSNSDPFFAHFPELKTLLRENAKGRLSSELLKIANDSGLMRDWHVRMRYAPAAAIKPNWVDKWENQAKDLVGRMDT